jgi:hypothetical protein
MSCLLFAKLNGLRDSRAADHSINAMRSGGYPSRTIPEPSLIPGTGCPDALVVAANYVSGIPMASTRQKHVGEVSVPETPRHVLETAQNIIDR